MFNARDDKIADAIAGTGRSALATAFKKRRCLIPADGFFEWKTTPGVANESGKAAKPDKQPMYFQVDGGALYAFAGLWEEWRSRDGEILHSCSIITTSPNAVVAEAHNRMPVILPREAEAEWMSLDSDPVEMLTLLQPFPADRMSATFVSKRVGSVGEDDAGLIEAVVNSA